LVFDPDAYASLTAWPPPGRATTAHPPPRASPPPAQPRLARQHQQAAQHRAPPRAWPDRPGRRLPDLAPAGDRHRQRNGADRCHWKYFQWRPARRL